MASKKPRHRSEESEKAATEKDHLAAEVDALLRKTGADCRGNARNDTRGPTMEALLRQYTQSGSLTETNEDGEHPLFPSSEDKQAILETRNAQSRHLGLGDSLGGSGSGQDGATVARLDLKKSLERDKLPLIKEAFLAKGNALDVEQFVTMMQKFVVSDSELGLRGDEKLISNQLADLHRRLIENDGGIEPEPSAAEAAEGEAAGVTFMTATGAEATVSWSMFAKLLLDEGVVGDAVGSFNIVKVLSHIDFDKIAPLRDEFKQKGNALTLREFVLVMKKQFNHIFDLTALFDLHNEERLLLAQMINLFEMIDINGKDAMSWEEFTTFLVDQGMTEDVAREFDIIRFSISPCRDDTVHQSHVEKAFYFKHYDKIAFFEQGSKVLKLCTPDLVPYKELKEFTQTPLCAEYIDKYKYIAVACAGLTLSFYDVDNNLKPVRRFETKTAQIVMCWSETGQALFTADHEGRIFAWDLHKVRTGANRIYEPGQGDPFKDFLKDEIARQDPPMRHVEPDQSRLDGDNFGPEQGRSRRGRSGNKVKVTDPGHPNSGGTIVTMLLELPVLGQMASCGIDKNVMIWDVLNGRLRGTLRGHDMGVRCMAFATTTKVLVTGGFDYNLFVWNPYVGKSIHTIQGHTAPIVGIEMLGSTSNQVVSADSEGFMKTWDLGTYQCLQTLMVDEILNLRAFVSIPSHKRVLAADRKFVAYDYQNTGVADQTDEGPIIKAFYHPRLKVFVSGCTNHLRIWDAVTGQIKCVVSHKSAEITDFCLDDRGRKVFIADHSGAIYVHNATTGCEIKRLTPHTKEVSGLIYCWGDKNVITVSWDKSIVVHDESEKTPKIWRNATHVHNGDITCVAFSRHLGLIATGSTDFVISLREYERLRTTSSLLGHKTDITALAFVEPFPLLVSSDFGGNVAIWAVPPPSGKPPKHVNEVLTRFINMQSLESSAPVNCLDPVIDTKEMQFTLYTGDEDGDVRAWDLSQLLIAAELEPCAPKADWDPRKKDQLDATHTTIAMANKALLPETPELPIRIDQQVVRQLRSWKAHSDSVRSLKVYNNPECIVTAGYDHMVKIWKLEGQLMTVLRAYGATPWSFPVKANDCGLDEETLESVIDAVKNDDDDKSAIMEPGGKKARPRTTVPVFSLTAEVEAHQQKFKDHEERQRMQQRLKAPVEDTPVKKKEEPQPQRKLNSRE